MFKRSPCLIESRLDKSFAHFILLAETSNFSPISERVSPLSARYFTTSARGRSVGIIVSGVLVVERADSAKVRSCAAISALPKRPPTNIARAARIITPQWVAGRKRSPRLHIKVLAPQDLEDSRTRKKSSIFSLR